MDFTFCHSTLLEHRLGQNTLQRYLNTNRKYRGYKIIKYKILSGNVGKYKIQIL